MPGRSATAAPLSARSSRHGPRDVFARCGLLLFVRRPSNARCDTSRPVRHRSFGVRSPATHQDNCRRHYRHADDVQRESHGCDHAECFEIPQPHLVATSSRTYHPALQRDVREATTAMPRGHVIRTIDWLVPLSWHFRLHVGCGSPLPSHAPLPSPPPAPRRALCAGPPSFGELGRSLPSG